MSFTTAPPLRYLAGAPRGDGAANAPVRNPCRGALPLLGEVPSAHTGERGRQSSDMSRGEKKERTKIIYTGRHRGRPLQENFGFSADSNMPPRAPANPVGDGLRAVPQSRIPPPHNAKQPRCTAPRLFLSRFQISARINTPRPNRSYAWRACRSRRRPRRASPARRGCSARTSPPSPSCPARTAGRRTTWS